MKAAVLHDYGAADMLKLEDVPQPSPAENEVLIKVRAASVNPLDWRLMKGEPRVLRLMSRGLKMQGRALGVDVAGEVAAAGNKVTQFQAGDQVFGGCRGAFAEFTCAKESDIASKPEAISFAYAAAVNVAGLTALQGLREAGRIQAGQKILINGASGGVGTFAVQIAKSLGAQVTGVCSTKNLDLIKSIGAADTIDYTKEDFTQSTERYDLIFDCIGNHSLSACRRVLKANGRSVLIGAAHDISLFELLGIPVKAFALSLFSSKKTVFYIGKSRPRDLIYLAELITSGRLTPVIDRLYELSETADAVSYLATGHARGKVIIDVDRADER
jgi:NADPH:quinone reductase-like Zn-dependent oxidoreductase